MPSCKVELLHGIPLLEVGTAVIGSGSAALNAADCLHALGQTDVAVFAERVNCGTSRNAGSDKQTYYKISLAGDEADSVGALAADLYGGGGINGGVAYAMAANSARCFLKLCELGIPFPTNEYGAYVGYQTDHDRRRRATSAGPLTSKYMTEALEKSVRGKDIPILDGMTVFRLLTTPQGIAGFLCIDHARLNEPARGLTAVRANQVILATGGPAGCYEKSVFPHGQIGMSGMALEAGAAGANLQEWQYGLASVGFRWNVSGSYQQVLPRYVSVDENGAEREFLADALGNTRALQLTFLKGYQWPFDSEKIRESSLVDLLVYHENSTLGRRVYLDYRQNPAGLSGDFAALDAQTLEYLTNSNALQPIPLARLAKMNPRAIALYAENGIDLAKEMLEIGVCAQHHNGGLAVDANWQTSLPGLYAVGEAAGTFGAARPGGSALAAGQIGGLRAARHIAQGTAERGFPLEETIAECNTLLTQWAARLRPDAAGSALQTRAHFAAAMSRCAAQLRDQAQMQALAREIRAALAGFYENAVLQNPAELPALLQTRDTLQTQCALLDAMIHAAESVQSHGGALVVSPKGAEISPAIPLRALPHRALAENRLLITRRTGQKYRSEWQPVSPLPKPEDWFEAVYNK